MALVRELNPTLRLSNLKKLLPIRRPEDFRIGPKPRCSSATFKEFVPVRPKPGPIISKAMLLSRRVFAAGATLAGRPGKASHTPSSFKYR